MKVKRKESRLRIKRVAHPERWARCHIMLNQDQYNAHARIAAALNLNAGQTYQRMLDCWLEHNYLPVESVPEG